MTKKMKQGGIVPAQRFSERLFVHASTVHDAHILPLRDIYALNSPYYAHRHRLVDFLQHDRMQR
jgi:hypothetical protein